MTLRLRFLVALVRCRLAGHGRPVEMIFHDGETLHITVICTRCGRSLGRRVRGRQGPKPRPYRRRHRPI